LQNKKRRKNHHARWPRALIHSNPLRVMPWCNENRNKHTKQMRGKQG
jgi:hypothetical protein